MRQGFLPSLRIDEAVAALRRWDLRVCAGMNRALRYRAVHAAFHAISRLGDGVFWYGLMLALLLAEGSAAAPAVVHMALTGIVATLAYRALKSGTLRPRPFEVHAHIAAGAAPLDRFSFPSGHTLHAVSFTIIAGAYYPVLALPLLAFSLAVAASRVVLGLHYPSDVIAGAALGGSLALVSLRLL